MPPEFLFLCLLILIALISVLIALAVITKLISDSHHRIDNILTTISRILAAATVPNLRNIIPTEFSPSLKLEVISNPSTIEI